MKYAGNSRLNRQTLNRVFGRKVGRPDEECFELDAFIVNTMCGCGWDVRDSRDVHMFNMEFGNSSVDWRRWFAGYSAALERDAKLWVVVEKQNGTPVWTWFERGLRVGEWTPIGQDTEVTMRVVPFKEGSPYNKTIPMEE